MVDHGCYHALVSLLSERGKVQAWGYAREERYQETVHKRWEGGVLLEKVKEERPEAIGLCLSRAWQQVRGLVDGSPCSPGAAADGAGWEHGLATVLGRLLVMARSNGTWGGHRVAPFPPP